MSWRVSEWSLVGEQREAMDGAGAHGKQLQAPDQAAEVNGDKDI